MLSKSFFWKRVAREAENGVEHKLMSSPASNLKRLCGLSAVGCRLSAVGCRLSAVGLILLLGLGLFAFFKIKKTVPAQSVSGSGKELMLSPQVQHLGKINQHEAKEFSFTLTNTSQETIEVEKISQSCGCTQARVDQSQLKPGESTMLRGSLTAQDRVGEFGSVIQVSLSNGTVAKVQVGAQAVTMLQVPKQIELGTILLGQKAQPYVFEVEKGEAQLEWDLLKVKAGELQSEVQKLGAGRWQVKLQAGAEQSAGLYREEIQFEMVDSKKAEEKPKTVSATVFWKVESEHFKVSPQGVYLSGERVGKVRIKSLKGREVKVSLAEQARLRVRQVKEEGEVLLEIENFQTKDQPNKQVPWSGKTQLVLHDGFVQEKSWLSIIQ
jgi:hypothetical protein